MIYAIWIEGSQADAIVFYDYNQAKKVAKEEVKKYPGMVVCILELKEKVKGN